MTYDEKLEAMAEALFNYRDPQGERLWGRDRSALQAKAAAESIVLREMMEALDGCVAVLTDDRVGTVNNDDPDWYVAVDKAVAAARALSP